VARNYITGKRWSKTHDRWDAADAWWRREEREADGSYTAAGIGVSRQQRGIPSFADYVVSWARGGIEDCELATQRGYQSQARSLAEHWSTQRVDEITKKMVSDYLVELRNAGCSPATRTLRLTVLRHTMRAAIDDGHRLDDPTLGIKGPRRREHQARVLTEAELMLVLASLPGWLWPAALLSHDAGLRIGEVCGLRMMNLDLLRGTVHVVDIIDVDGQLRTYPKSKISRPVKLSQRCLAALRDHVGSAHSPAGPLGYVFANPHTGGCLSPARVRVEWDRALELAALEGDKPTWHDLRHSCATAMANAGKDPWVIQSILGHGSIATTQRYVRGADLSRQVAAVSVFGEQTAM
jgi:site-specific recombinase XerD